MNHTDDSGGKLGYRLFVCLSIGDGSFLGGGRWCFEMVGGMKVDAR